MKLHCAFLVIVLLALLPSSQAIAVNCGCCYKRTPTFGNVIARCFVQCGDEVCTWEKVCTYTYVEYFDCARDEGDPCRGDDPPTYTIEYMGCGNSSVQHGSAVCGWAPDPTDDDCELSPEEIALCYQALLEQIASENCENPASTEDTGIVHCNETAQPSCCDWPPCLS